MKKEKTMHLVIASAMVVMCMGLTGCASAPMSNSQVENQRAEVLEMARQTRMQFLQMYPDLLSTIDNAAGSAVFSNFGFKFLFMGSANGEGVAHNNITKKDTFMKMVELQPGFGFGAQQFKVLFIFDTEQAFDKFVNYGWEFGSNLKATAKANTQGVGAQYGVVASPGVTMYQLDNTGIIVGVSLTGAKYYKDGALN
jgi:lipid-binding SYLF domain-containing protein